MELVNHLCFDYEQKKYVEYEKKGERFKKKHDFKSYAERKDLINSYSEVVN